MKNEEQAGRISTAICAFTALAAGTAFLAYTTWKGGYTSVARAGGAVWIFTLMMIVLLPLVMPRMKERLRGEGK